MKKTLLFLTVLTVIFMLPLTAGEKIDIEKEKATIKKVSLDYIEGFYEGSAERMERALHPEFHKKGLNLIKETGKNMLSGAGYSKMVELTRLGLGKKTPKEERKIQVVILDVFKKTASVKTISAHYIDYLHLVKFNGQWKILNALWEANK